MISEFIKVSIQVIEIAIGVSIALLVGNVVFKLFVNTDFFNFFKELFYNLGALLGSTFTSFAYVLFLGAIIIMIGRWIVSWSSTNSGQTPNNKGN